MLLYIAQHFERTNVTEVDKLKKLEHYDNCPCGSGKTLGKCGMLDVEWVANDKNKCANCQVSNNETDLKKCSRCKEVRYCSRKCQVDHYPDHKFYCRKLKQQRKKMKKPLVLTHAGHSIVTEEDVRTCFIDLYENHSHTERQVDSSGSTTMCSGCNIRPGPIDVNITQNVNTVHGIEPYEGDGRLCKYKGLYNQNKRLHLCKYCISLHGGACDFANHLKTLDSLEINIPDQIAPDGIHVPGISVGVGACDCIHCQSGETDGKSFNYCDPQGRSMTLHVPKDVKLGVGEKLYLSRSGAVFHIEQKSLIENIEGVQKMYSKKLKSPLLYEHINVHNNFGQ